MHPLEAVLLGVIEGVAEFLPISSTGHLILASYALGIPDSASLTSFIIAIQCGAIAAVLTLYWRALLNVQVLSRLAVAFLPTAIIGVTVYRVVKDILLGNEMVVVVALFVGGVLLILFERWHTETADATDTVTAITYTQAFKLGLFQSIAMIPGVSRSGATILGGLLLGMKRTTIVQFTFLLAVPTMLAATGYDLLQSYESFTSHNWLLIGIGTLSAYVSGLLALRFLLAYVKRHDFTVFGVYRIVLALVFLVVVL
jgi:undecaprenyl-diphosphatase